MVKKLLLLCLTAFGALSFASCKSNGRTPKDDKAYSYADFAEYLKTRDFKYDYIKAIERDETTSLKTEKEYDLNKEGHYWSRMENTTLNGVHKAEVEVIKYLDIYYVINNYKAQADENGENIDDNFKFYVTETEGKETYKITENLKGESGAGSLLVTFNFVGLMDEYIGHALRTEGSLDVHYTYTYKL